VKPHGPAGQAQDNKTIAISPTTITSEEELEKETGSFCYGGG